MRCSITNSSRSCGSNLRRHGTWGRARPSASLLPAPQEIQRVLAILRAAYDGAAAAAAAAAAASVVAAIGGCARGTMVGTAAVDVPGGNPAQAAAVAVVICAGVATRADGTVVIGAVAGGVGKSARKRGERYAATNKATSAAAAAAARSEVLGKTTRSVSMVRQLLVVVMVKGIRMVELLLRVYSLVHVQEVSVFSLVVNACSKTLEARTSRGEVRTKQEEIADVRAGITERCVGYRALPT